MHRKKKVMVADFSRDSEPPVADVIVQAL